ncbi:pseudouridine synthase [Cupriavidus numazuensis]|uniref:pseudouridine synthase n=2 Tax=Cupriavidus numazuensis TaxID=221992 RepID=UPI003616FCE9
MTDSNSPKRKTLGIKPPDGTATRKPTGNRPVRVSDLNRKRVQAVAEGIRRAQGGAGAKSGKGGMPPADPAAGRAPRPARGDSDRPPRQGRPADGERQARPRRFDDDQSRPRRFGDDDNRPRRFGNDDRAPRRFGDDEARPRRFSDDNRPQRPRRPEGGEQPQRRFRDDESRPRRFGDDEARPRRFSDDNRPQRPRRPEGGEQPQRRFRDDESRPRRFGDDEARPRRFSDDNRPQRPRRPEGGEQPQRRFRDDESRPRRFGDDEARPRRFSDDNRPQRPRRAEGGEQPQRRFRDDESRPRRFGDDDRQRRAPDAGARRGDAPARRFSDTADRARPVRAERQPAHSSGDSPETSHDDGLVRLSKRMSELGLCSRREADEWIPRGWVIVDGKPVTELGSRVRADANIEIHQAARSEQGERVTVLLHKPMGYVSGQAEDGYEPAAVLFTAENQWSEDPTRKRFAPWQRKSLAPAGRLDIDSTGLLVLTQDGRVARALIGEDSNVEKEYLVRVQWHSPDGVVERNVSEVFPADKLELLRHGLSLDGVVLKPAKVSWQNEEQLRFVLREGRKRQIRRMCEQVGLEVVGLKRVRMGRIVLGDLPPGQWRFLGPFEKF